MSAESDNGQALAPHGDATDLHGAIAELVRAVHAETRSFTDDVLERFAALARTHIPGTDRAGFVLHDHRRSPSATHEMDGYPALVNELLDDCGEGPMLDCSRTQAVRVDDLSDEKRWPRFAAAVRARTPVRSMLCFALYTAVDDIGALTLYSPQAHVFDAAAEESGAIVATHTALTLEFTQRSRQFRSALGSRDIIGQAKGMLMERYGIGAGAAFALLTKVSQESRKPVVAVAKEIVEDKTHAR